MANTHTLSGDDVLGTWKTGDGDLHVKIYKNGNMYNGIIIWMKEPNDANEKPKSDKFNPDSSKRKNPILGNTIMVDKVTFIGENTWDNGIIYDARKEQTTIVLSE